jgi:hypothetical protein
VPDDAFQNASPTLVYTFVVASIALATLLRWLLDPVLGNQLPFSSFS